MGESKIVRFKNYLATTICLSVFLFLGAMTMAMVIVPKSKGADPTAMYFTATVMLLFALVLLGTSVFMLWKKEVDSVVFVVQCFMLVLSFYGIPIAIWGYVLWKKRDQDQPRPADDAGKCHECGLELDDTTSIAFGEVKVCPSCKDVYAQRLKEGVETEVG